MTSSNKNNNKNNKITTNSLIDYTRSKKEATTGVIRSEEKSFSKRILIVDDDPDMTSIFSIGLQDEGFEVYSYNDPLKVLLHFRPRFYDLLLIDINMPKMNGIELSRKILDLDMNVRICFITAGETNIEVLRELYPTRSIGCYIRKPVTIGQLVRRIKAELE